MLTCDKRGKIIQRVTWHKPTCLRLVSVKLFCLLLYNKQGKEFKARRKNSNRLNGKRQFIVNWRWLWDLTVLLPSHAFKPDTHNRDILRYFSLWDCVYCRMIPRLFAEMSLSNHPGGQGSTCHHPLAVGRNLSTAIHHAGHNVVCLIIDNHLPLETHRTWISVLGFESRFAFFPCLKLPSSVILVWTIPGTRSSSFLQMRIWTWKPSFSLPTPSGSWDFPSFVKIVTYKRRKGLRAVHHVYFTWYVFAFALTQAVFTPNDSSICSPTPFFCVAYVEHLVLKVSQFLNIF